MQHPLTVLYTPLPQGSTAELVAWRCAFETVLEPWLDARQWKHVNRFGRAAWQQDASIADAENCGPTPCGQNVVEAALSRLLARALLVTAAARHHRGGPLPQTGMDTRGRPLLSGWQAAFSHSGRAAFCALTPAGAAASATLGLDATPIEGFFPEKLDAALGLGALGLKSVVVASIGYRSEQDFNASLNKSRLPAEQLITRL